MNKKIISFLLLLTCLITFAIPSFAMSIEERNKTDVNYGALLQKNDIKSLHDEVTKFIEANPNATEDDINNFLKGEMKTLYLSNKTDKTDLDSLRTSRYWSPHELNPDEQALYDEDCWKGLQALWEGKKALEEAEKRYSSGLHNGNGDAFRHAYWNALMTKHIDYNWANRWATAHETGASQPDIEKTMDMFNNGRGRAAGIGTDDLSDQELADIVQRQVRNGWMYRIVNGELVDTNSEGEW